MAENTTTTSTDTITGFVTEGAKRGQEAVSAAVGAWTDAFGSLRTFRPTAADARGLVDTSYTAAEKVLASQRDFAKGVIDAGARVVETVGEQATAVTEKVRARTSS